MTLDSVNSEQPIIRLPRHIFIFCIITAWLLPFLARILSVPMHGWSWFTDYLAGVGGFLFISALK